MRSITQPTLHIVTRHAPTVVSAGRRTTSLAQSSLTSQPCDSDVSSETRSWNNLHHHHSVAQAGEDDSTVERENCRGTRYTGAYLGATLFGSVCWVLGADVVM